LSSTYANAALIAAGLVGLAFSVRLVASPLVGVALVPEPGPAPVATASPHPTNQDSAGDAIAKHDPFRIARRPSPVTYDPVRFAQPVTPPVPRPMLFLVGVVWDNGKDPTALVEGLPGVDGPRPLRRGDTLAGLRVKMIRADDVVITGLDTTWTLKVREPWR